MPAKSFDTSSFKQLRIERDETREVIFVVAEDQRDVITDLRKWRVKVSNHQDAIKERAPVSIFQLQIVRKTIKRIARSGVSFEECLSHFQQQLPKRHRSEEHTSELQ